MIQTEANSGDPKRWLIISYYANVNASAMSHWVDDRLAELEKSGIECYLLSSPYGPQYRNRLHIRVPSIAPYTFQYELHSILHRTDINATWQKLINSSIFILLWPLYVLQKKFMGLGGTHLSWSCLAVVAGFLMCTFRRPTLIYATGGPTSAHISAMVLSRLLAIPYIVEFQDPLVTPSAGRNKLFRQGLARFEKMVHRTATRVIYCTQNARCSADRRYNSGKTEAIYGGAPRDMAPPEHYVKGSTCRFAYFGTLYGSRNLDKFLTALDMIITEQPEMANQVKVELYGAVVGEALEKIEGFSRGVISLHPFVDRSTALSIAATADVLLLVQHIAMLSSETIPSKVYDYFLTRRPVLGLVFQNDELKMMLESEGHLAVAADDELAIRNAISVYLEKWTRGDLSHDYSPVRTYTTEDAVRRLLESLNLESQQRSDT